MDIDELDRLVMEELEDDARQSVQGLAKKLGMKRTTVRNRLNRLITEGILSIECVASPEAMGYQYVLIIGINILPGKAASVAKKLAHLPVIHVIYLAAGRYNILAGAILKDRLALTHFVSKNLAEISDITAIEMIHSFQRVKNSWRYFKPRMESFDIFPPPGRPSEFDLSIIKALQQDPRQTLTKLARTLDCSRAIAKTGIERLMKDGIIRFVSLVDPIALGYSIGVMMLIKSKPEKTYAVANSLSMLHIASHVILTTSQWQIVVLAQFHNSGHMDRHLSDTLPSIPGISEIEVVHLTKTMKYSSIYGWFGSL